MYYGHDHFYQYSTSDLPSYFYFTRDSPAQEVVTLWKKVAKRFKPESFCRITEAHIDQGQIRVIRNFGFVQCPLRH